MKSKNVRRRLEAVKALSVSNDARAVDALLDVIRSGDHEARGVAAKGLARIGGAKVVSSLVNMLRDRGAAPYLREAAMTALGLIGDRKAVGPLVEILESGHGEYTD